MNTPQKHDFITFNIEYIDMKRLVKFCIRSAEVSLYKRALSDWLDFRLLEGEKGGAFGMLGRGGRCTSSSAPGHWAESMGEGLLGPAWQVNYTTGKWVADLMSELADPRQKGERTKLCSAPFLCRISSFWFSLRQSWWIDPCCRAHLINPRQDHQASELSWELLHSPCSPLSNI